MSVVNFRPRGGGTATRADTDWHEPPQLQVIVDPAAVLVLTMFVPGMLSADLLASKAASREPILVNVVAHIAKVWMQPPMDGCEGEPWTLEVADATFPMPSEAEASRVIEFLASLPGDRRA